MANRKDESLWKERVAQWRNSGLSQRAFGVQHGYSHRQLSVWARRLAMPNSMPALLPLAIGRTGDVAPALSLRSPSGWTVMLPSGLQTNWVAELLRSLA